MVTMWILLTQLFLLQTVKASLVNVAKGKNASMSSEKSGFVANTAVDGDTVTSPYGSGTVINTADINSFAWWKVDLQNEVQDATVRIYFRTDYAWRRNGVELYTSTSSFPDSNPTSQGQLWHTVTGDPSGSDIPDVYSVTCSGRWRYLLLYTDTDNDGLGQVLDFGEVEVLVCSTGTYGEDCTKTCSSRNCVTMTTCDRDGRCTDGCQSRWTGIDCRQLTPCNTINKYGQKCDKLCSDRKCKRPPSSSCDSLTGRCDNGCEDGWRQEDCTQECGSGSYGASCALFCILRRCLDGSSPCDHVTGQCVGGCQAGYKEPDCTQQCDSGSYGPGCSLDCTARKCRNPAGTCPHADGQCVNGCQPGYTGTDCIHKCDSGFYGDGCSLPCIARKCSVNSTVCDHMTGQCEGDCQVGYKGTDCIKACNQGINYGVNCIKSCSDRRCIQPSSVCDTKTGQCPGRCQEAWRGFDCTSQCPVGTFGSDCTSCSTRHCQGESDCPADGTCSQGCQDGYTGLTCMQTCPRNLYGPSCSMVCGNCSSDEACHHVTGNCPSGCKSGWGTQRCNEVCTNVPYGSDCTESSEEAPVYSTAASVVGAVIGTFLVVLLVVVGIHLCLVRQGRLQWVKNPGDKKQVQVSRDVTQMSNIASQPSGVTEHAQSSSHVYNNDYAVLDSGTKAADKDYDVIEQKHYQNV